MSEHNGVLTRAAPFRASSWNAETQTVEVILATPGAAVPRWDARGEFDELLDLAAQTYPASVPLLDSHQRGSTDHRLGVVTDIRVEGGDLVGKAKLSRSNERAQRIATDLADGMPYAASIGYRVDAWAETTSNGRRAKTATAFQLLESSFVSIPADPRAGTRSLELTTPATDTNNRAAVNAEIRGLADRFGLGREWADAQIDAGSTSDQARIAATTALEARTAPADTIRPRVQVGVDHNDPVAIRSAMADALASRISHGRINPSERGREYMGYRLADMVADLAFATGDRFNRFDQSAIAQRAFGAHSTADFPLLLADAGNKVLLSQYEAAAPTYRQWAARRSFTDFRAHKFLRIGDFPSMKEVPESGEMTFGTISENREQVSAKSYARGFTLTHEVLINDDLSVFSDYSSMIGTRFAADENALAYGVLTGSTVLSDGVQLFHTTHGNKAGTAGAISVATIGAAVASIRKQKGLDGVPLNLVPRFLIVGPDKELEARQVLASITATKNSDVNPWSGSLELVIDANIVGNGWYILASPESAPTIVFGYVAGTTGPQIQTQRDFNTRGIQIGAWLDWGIGAIDHRGAYMNAGA